MAEPLYQAQRFSNVEEIWVAEGTYYTEYKAAKIDGSNIAITNRNMTFVLVPDVKIYDDFPEEADDAKNAPSAIITENRALATLNWSDNPTILSGDIGLKGLNADNCYHVIISANAVGDACLDNFTITGGNADGSDDAMEQYSVGYK